MHAWFRCHLTPNARHAADMNVITALLFLFSGLLGGSSLMPKQIHYVSKDMTWTQAQSYCRDKYTDLLFVYSEEDLDKMRASVPHYIFNNAWVGGFELNSDEENITESQLGENTQGCPAIRTGSWKMLKRSCMISYSFFCSQSEGKRVVLRLKVNSDGQLDLKDPGISSDMLAKINEKFNQIGFGDAIQIQWMTRRETPRKNRANNICDLGTP